MSFAGTYNRLVTLGQDVDRIGREVENQYQRRADLVPNLVATVQGAANFEKDTLDRGDGGPRVGWPRDGHARQGADDPRALARFTRPLRISSVPLSQRLLVVSERYPELKATANFRDLQAQLEGTENRIAVARAAIQRVRAGLQHGTLKASRRTSSRAFSIQGEAVLQGATAGAEQAPRSSSTSATRAGRTTARDPATSEVGSRTAAESRKARRAEGTLAPGGRRVLGLLRGMAVLSAASRSCAAAALRADRDASSRRSRRGTSRTGPASSVRASPRR